MTDAAVEIPKQAREGMRGFASLSPGEADAVIDSLRAFDGILRPPAIERRIRLAAPSLSDPAGFTFGLLTLIAQAPDMPSAEAAASVAQSRDLGEIADADREKFKNGLEQLLGIACLRLSAKAWDLTTEYEHVFLSARILTDVRPVFGEGDRDDQATTPTAAVIVNTLKLDYYGHQAWYP
jgi:hypothetical protein